MTVLTGSQVSTINDGCNRLINFVQNEVFKYSTPDKNIMPMSVTTTSSLVNPLPTETVLGTDSWAYEYCNYPQKPQLGSQCIYYIASFNNIKDKLSADSTHDIPSPTISAWLSLFNSLSQWINNVKGKYVGDYIDAIVFKPTADLPGAGGINIPAIGSQGVGSACRVTNFGSYTVVTPVHYKVPDNFKTLCDSAIANCKQVIDSINQPSAPPPAKELKPVPSIETGTTDLIEAIGKIYDLCNDQFSYINTKTTLISDNTEDSINLLNTLTGNVDTLLNTVNKYHESENNALYEAKVRTQEISDKQDSYHQSENDALYEISINTQKIQVAIDDVKTAIGTLASYINDSNQVIAQNLQTIAAAIPDKDSIQGALQQIENSNNSYYNDLVSRLSAIENRLP